MIIILKSEAAKEDADEILAQIEAAGLKPLYMPGSERVVLGAIGDERVLGQLHLDSHPMVESVKAILSPYKLVTRDVHPHDHVVELGHGVSIGGGTFTVIGGPCAIESLEQMRATAVKVKEAGGLALRGGAFKPRTSPYSFQGLGLEGLEILKQVSDELSMPSFTEVVEVADVEVVHDHASGFQVGARSMQNFRLLKALGETRKPVLLKRGMAAKIDDLLNAAEYILSGGNEDVILCERGITTFETATRNTLDLNAIPVLKKKSHLPVIVDPSHGIGIREFVIPMALAAVACGADGVIVETHIDPAKALSDGKQSLYPEQFADMVKRVRAVAEAVGKTCP
ncbi:MAG: 3-deoxy-7-phosphoheptulonate synthase [Planctomycetes bacterium]|nr:3-deoxy-7-phosphoheptulonate synthase [Planctomycetota bacterium]